MLKTWGKSVLLTFSAAIYSMGYISCNYSNEEKSPPNIILIISDDQGYGDFSCFGNEIVKTPALDLLHQQSTTFSKMIMSPVCAPSRASIMTGRHNYRTGVWDTWKARCNMNGDEKTIAEYFVEGGYRTALFGKWHLGYNTPMRPVDQGFEETFTWEEYAKESQTRINPVMRVNGGEPEIYNGYLDDVIFDRAIDYLKRNKNSKKPFFKVVASFLPHDCDTPVVPRQYIDRFQGLRLSPHTTEVYGMIEKLDENVGRLLRALDELNLAQNTVVVYASDNGPQFTGPRDQVMGVSSQQRFNLGMRGAKTSVYDGGIILPCFFRWPDHFEPGRTIDRQVAHIDLLPTLLDICGLIPPNTELPGVDGISLYPALKNKDVELPSRHIVIQSDRSEVPQPFVQSCVRGDKYKLVNGKDLYDLENDPSESKNVAEFYPEKVEELRQIYLEWFDDVKSSRGFIPSPSYVGTSAQEEIVLQFFNRNDLGWPVKVFHDGPYSVTIENYNAGLFPDGGKIYCDFNGTVFFSELPKKSGQIVISGVTPPLGQYFLNVYTEGYKLPRIGRWRQEDVGYRNVIITKEKN